MQIIRQGLAAGQEYDLKIGGKTSGTNAYGYLTIRSFGWRQARWHWQTVVNGVLAELPMDYDSRTDYQPYAQLVGNSNGTVTLYNGLSITTVGYSNPRFETVLIRSYARWDDMYIGNTITGENYYHTSFNDRNAIYPWNGLVPIYRSSDRVCGAVDSGGSVFYFSQNNNGRCGRNA